MRKLIQHRVNEKQKWYLVKDFMTKAGYRAIVMRCEWTNLSYLKARALFGDNRHIKTLFDFCTGYVEVPEEKKINTEELEVHGGVTFGLGEIESFGGQWVGFDMAHFGDWTINEIEEIAIDYAAEECEELARQIKEL